MGDDVATDPRQRIAKIILAEQQSIRLSPYVEHERKAALYDLLEDNHFALIGEFTGPYVVHLSVVGEQLHFVVEDEAGTELKRFALSLGSLRRTIKDYFLICDSYYGAIKTMMPSKIEAIDMGRRGLHNEGAALLRERLADKVTIDNNTARRLYTLICVLHIRK